MLLQNVSLVLAVAVMCAFLVGCGPEVVEEPAVATVEEAVSEPEKPVESEKPVEPEKPVESKKAAPSAEFYKAGEAVWVIDDFESDKNRWRVEPWADPAKLSISNAELKIELGDGEYGKSIISHVCSLDLSDRGSLVLNVRNKTGKPVKIAVALMTGGSSVFFESEGVAARAGLTKNMTFDLRSDKFKSAASKWEYKVKLSDASAVKCLCILVYRESTGEVCLDNIRVVKNR